jgi:sterol desaturase/sphingolipid hydroxylase (fatty acid hydroxylase superfamily)
VSRASPSGVIAFKPFDVVGIPVVGTVLAVCSWRESVSPLRRRVQPRRDRLRVNGAMIALAFVILRLAFIPLVLWIAGHTADSRLGLLPVLPVPAVFGGIAGFLLLDYTTWIWHRLNHQIPVLWRFHSVHHTDLDLDASTSFRFHAGELLLSIVYRSMQVALIGAGPALVLVYEIVLDASTAFHHSNWRLSTAVERGLVRVIVTPRMHGIHHSIVERETNSNWASILTWWDRLHGTLRLDVPQQAIVIGLPAYRGADELTLGRLLAMPFLRQRASWCLLDGTRPDRAPVSAPTRLAA